MGGTEWLRGAEKPQKCHKYLLQQNLHLLPKDFRFEHGGAKFASCPGRRLTSIHTPAAAHCDRYKCDGILLLPYLYWEKQYLSKTKTICLQFLHMASTWYYRQNVKISKSCAPPCPYYLQNNYITDFWFWYHNLRQVFWWWQAHA